MSTQGQGFIRRNRPPRVHITYEDPYNAEKLIELPFVMGVLSDLSGNAPGAEKPPVEERKFVSVDMDNFDEFMGSVKPGVSMAVENRLDPDASDKLLVKLDFRSIEDFSPGQVARNVPETRKLLEARERLANLKSFMDGKASASAQLKALLSDPDLMAALKAKTSEEGAPAGNDEPKDDESR